jgi:hypothetical protein
MVSSAVVAVVAGGGAGGAAGRVPSIGAPERAKRVSLGTSCQMGGVGGAGLVSEDVGLEDNREQGW